MEFVEVSEGGDGVRVRDEVGDMRRKLRDHRKTDRRTADDKDLGQHEGVPREMGPEHLPVSDEFGHQELAVLALQHLLVQSIELDRNPVALLLASMLHNLSTPVRSIVSSMARSSRRKRHNPRSAKPFLPCALDRPPLLVP